MGASLVLGGEVSKDADRRAVVTKVFRCVLQQRALFATPAEERLRTVWDLGVVTQNEMYSDDSFEFNAALGRLRKVTCARTRLAQLVTTTLRSSQIL